LSGGERNDMADNFQKKWLKAGQFEELPEGALTDNLGVEIIVAGLKSDALQVKLHDLFSSQFLGSAERRRND
jgi:hypothetical protein